MDKYKRKIVGDKDMAFKSINEVDKFAYDDCISHKMEIGEDIKLELEAIIVKANNSANSNYTDSYADETLMVFEKARITKVILEGYKYYSANDVLLEEVPDKELPLEECDWARKFSRVFLINVEKVGDNTYILEFEMPDTDPSARTDVYEVTLEATNVNVSWERYMNRVQK